MKTTYELTFPGPDRIYYVADAFRCGWSLEKFWFYVYRQVVSEAD